MANLARHTLLFFLVWAILLHPMVTVGALPGTVLIIFFLTLWFVARPR